MPRRPAQQKLTILLLRDGLKQADALRDDKDLKGHRIPALSRDRDLLFSAATPPHPPRWARYLTPHMDGSLEGLMSASASAVLLLEASGRLFALTFGGGRHLLRQDALVQDFGLKVVLNTVEPSQLKSVDAKTIDDTTVHTRRDLSHESSFAAFGLDVTRDLLRAVTGRPEDESLGSRLTGADALGIHTHVRVPELPALLGRLFTAYQDDRYKENFDFIDHLRPEKNKARLHELNETLIEALDEWEIDDVHLAVPETLDWLDIEGFRYAPGDRERELDNDPRISAYLDTRNGRDIDLDVLRNDRLVAIRSSDGGIADRWSIYSCLVYQVELYNHLYVLSTGDWFRVDRDYRDKVEREVHALPNFRGLPDADAGTDEDAYNRKAATALRALCLDRQFIHEPGRDKMEVCDILTRDAGLIHVKQRGSSSTLSHLFTQGLNSAERLLFDQDFRTKAHALTKRVDASFARFLPRRGTRAEKHQIVFAVITRSNRRTPLTLPFFSVVSLRAAASRLEAYGFPVSTAEIREQ